MYQQSVETSESEFTQVPNKARLWKLLQSNGAFNNINNNFFTKVQEEFEITVQRTEEEHKNKETMQKCKIFIDNMVEKMKQYKYLPSVTNVTQSSDGTTSIFPSREPPYTSTDLKKSRLDAFDSELNKKQSEFNEFNTKPTPPHVDFTDKEEESSGDVNNLLEKAMRERERLNLPTPPVNQQATNKQSIVNNIENDILKKNTTNNDNVNNDNVNNDNVNNDNVNNDNVNNSEMLLKILDKLEKIEQMLKEERERKN